MNPTQSLLIPPPQQVHCPGITFSVHIGGPANGLPVVLLHGFPELAFSWRHQIAALAQAGFRVIAPDLRGYGGTGPQGVLADYRLAQLSADVIALLDELGIDQMVLVGHDFGGALAWSTARDHRDRVRGVASFCTPYTRRGKVDLLEAVRLSKGSSHYMLTFQEPGAGEALLEHDIAALFDCAMRRPAIDLSAFQRLPADIQALPASLFWGVPGYEGASFLDKAERSVFVQAFARTGFTGPLNWYRNLRRNWEDTAGTNDQVDVPALMVSAADDYFLPPTTTEGMERCVPDLERHVVASCGHWMQQERPDEVNHLLINWLQRRMLA